MSLLKLKHVQKSGISHFLRSQPTTLNTSKVGYPTCKPGNGQHCEGCVGRLRPTTIINMGGGSCKVRKRLVGSSCQLGTLIFEHRSVFCQLFTQSHYISRVFRFNLKSRSRLIFGENRPFPISWACAQSVTILRCLSRCYDALPRYSEVFYADFTMECARLGLPPGRASAVGSTPFPGIQ